jgi:acyl-CoA synthetase (AMP-forming)/AMP-acid ligase II
LRPGQTADVELLIAFARLSLAAYKIPRRMEIGVSLPRTASGKIQRGRVRERYLSPPSSG